MKRSLLLNIFIYLDLSYIQLLLHALCIQVEQIIAHLYSYYVTFQLIQMVCCVRSPIQRDLLRAFIVSDDWIHSRLAVI